VGEGGERERGVGVVLFCVGGLRRGGGGGGGGGKVPSLLHATGTRVKLRRCKA